MNDAAEVLGAIYDGLCISPPQNLCCYFLVSALDHFVGAGEMSDAAEVLGAIYDGLCAVEGGAELVDAVFGLHVSERVHCAACGKDTHANAYTQFFYNAHATALRLQVLRMRILPV